MDWGSWGSLPPSLTYSCFAKISVIIISVKIMPRGM